MDLVYSHYIHNTAISFSPQIVLLSYRLQMFRNSFHHSIPTKDDQHISYHGTNDIGMLVDRRCGGRGFDAYIHMDVFLALFSISLFPCLFYNLT
jgi:hypothetical protein